MKQIYFNIEGWGLDENFEYIHLLDNGKVSYVTLCAKCNEVFPDEQWAYLRKIRILALGKKA